MRFRVYALLSTLICALTIRLAFREKGQFYPTMLYLQSSKFCFVVVCNMALVLGISLGRLLTAVFLGSLRLIEIEHLYDRSWYAVTETCLAMTIFREEFNARFMLLFGVLLLLKILHWLVQDRVEYIEQSPNVRLLTHARLLGLLALLTAVDGGFYFYALSTTVRRGPSVLLLFAFETMILQSSVLFVYLKYLFLAVDRAMRGRWEQKGEFLFYLELFTDLLQLVLYLAFFLIIFAFYGLPLHIVRELYTTFRNFRQRLSDFLRYRRVMGQLGSLDAVTEEDLEYDATCIICREEVVPIGGRKLLCGHLFHCHCLRSWLQRQQTCPTFGQPGARLPAGMQMPMAFPPAEPNHPHAGMPGQPPQAAHAVAPAGAGAGPGEAGAFQGQGAAQGTMGGVQAPWLQAGMQLPLPFALQPGQFVGAGGQGLGQWPFAQPQQQQHGAALLQGGALGAQFGMRPLGPLQAAAGFGPAGPQPGFGQPLFMMGQQPPFGPGFGAAYGLGLGGNQAWPHAGQHGGGAGLNLAGNAGHFFGGGGFSAFGQLPPAVPPAPGLADGAGSSSMAEMMVAMQQMQLQMLQAMQLQQQQLSMAAAGGPLPVQLPVPSAQPEPIPPTQPAGAAAASPAVPSSELLVSQLQAQLELLQRQLASLAPAQQAQAQAPAPSAISEGAFSSSAGGSGVAGSAIASASAAGSDPSPSLGLASPARLQPPLQFPASPDAATSALARPDAETPPSLVALAGAEPTAVAAPGSAESAHAEELRQRRTNYFASRTPD